MLVVAYDVANHRRRARLHTLLLGFGQPVQESLFECVVTAAQERRLRARIARITRASDDNVRFYRLCAACADNVSDLRGPSDTPPAAHVV